jgi:hypothetical protein
MQSTKSFTFAEYAGCNYCKHLQTDGNCKAFLNGIPLGIVSGDFAHIEVVEELGQVGNFVYELNPDKKLPKEA